MRTAETYRAFRRNLARQRKFLWRELPPRRVKISDQNDPHKIHPSPIIIMKVVPNEQ